LAPDDPDGFPDEFQSDEIGMTDQRAATAQIPAWLDVDSRVSIGCAGAIIASLQRRRSAEFLQDDPDAQLAYRIAYLEMFTLRNTMLVSTDTLSSLQIIQPESHPNVFNQGPGTKGAKESLSVFGLFQMYAKTPQGKGRLRQIFLTPSTDLDSIIARQDFISIFARPDNQPISEQLSKSFSKIKNMRNAMTMLHKGIEAGTRFRSFKSGVWSSLLEFCYYAIDVVECLHEVAAVGRLAICAQAAEILDPHALRRIGKLIHDIVDLEVSEEQHRTVVKRGVKPGLDQVKDVYNGMDELLSRVAQDVARTMPPEIDCQINVIFFPQLGFHITVPLDELSRLPLWEGDETWQRMFITNNMAYFKENKMRQMDHDLGDMWASICDVEIEIVHDLAQQVLEDEDFLIRASDLCGELDCLMALAHGTTHYNLTRPHFSDENVIAIRGGRNLLQEMCVPSYVSNDTSLAGGSGNGPPAGQGAPSVLVLTGPNFSGKSVYQNGIATIVYMAQIGCFVPADQCTLGITDKILTRIATVETVSKSQSAFMIDLQQIALALNSCTRQSLIVIDEFGKGTDMCDGAGLAAGVLQHFIDLGPECPKVLAATHFHEIFELGLFEDEPNLAHAHMQVYVSDRPTRPANTDTSSELEDVVYLYQLQQGRSMLSYGAQCAAMHGVPRPVVQRAVALSDALAGGEDLVALCSDIGAAEMEDLVEAEKVSRSFCELDFQGGEGEAEGEREEEDVEKLLKGLLGGLIVGDGDGEAAGTPVL
jgi:DNA mismatch repair protein MSH5